MLGYLASWMVHNGGAGGRGGEFPVIGSYRHYPAITPLHTSRHVLAVGLHVEDCGLTGEGVAWMLFGGWGGLRPPGGWSSNVQEEMGHLRLDAPCAGVVVRFAQCAELYFHARDRYGTLHAEPAGARLGFMRAALARLIVGMDSDGRAVPDPIDDAIRVPREALPLRPEPGPRPLADALGGGRGPAGRRRRRVRLLVGRRRSGPGPMPGSGPGPGRAAPSARSPPASHTRSRGRRAP